MNRSPFERCDGWWRRLEAHSEDEILEDISNGEGVIDKPGLAAFTDNEPSREQESEQGK